MKIKKRLKRLCDSINSNITNINNGGCCVFAAHVAYVLKYRHSIPVNIRVERWYDDEDNAPSIDAARSNIADVSHCDAFDWNTNGISFSHVIAEVEIDGKVYHLDSNGLMSVTQPDVSAQSRIPLYKGSLTVEEALLICSEQSGWNHDFDRTQIPKIMDLIHAHLS